MHTTHPHNRVVTSYNLSGKWEKRMSGKNFTEIFGQNIREPVRVCPLNTESKKRIPNKMHHIDYKNEHRGDCKPKSVKTECGLIITALVWHKRIWILMVIGAQGRILSM